MNAWMLAAVAAYVAGAYLDLRTTRSGLDAGKLQEVFAWNRWVMARFGRNGILLADAVALAAGLLTRRWWVVAVLAGYQWLVAAWNWYAIRRSR